MKHYGRIFDVRPTVNKSYTFQRFREQVQSHMEFHLHLYSASWLNFSQCWVFGNKLYKFIQKSKNTFLSLGPQVVPSVIPCLAVFSGALVATLSGGLMTE